MRCGSAFSSVCALADELVYPIDGTIDLEDAWELSRLDRPDLQTTPGSRWRARPSAVRTWETSSRRSGPSTCSSTTPTTRSRRASSRSWNTSAADPNVIGIKSTVYRTSDDTPLVPALIEASENGKQSVCLVEIKARGDERRNIEWSRALEQAGVHVVYGFPTLKIHAKTTLVVRRESGGLRRYVHLGTGNYNNVTAKTYEDFGLFTADPEIAADVADLFNHLTGFGRPARFRKLLVAPFTLRQRLVEEIRESPTPRARARRRASVSRSTVSRTSR